MTVRDRDSSWLGDIATDSFFLWVRHKDIGKFTYQYFGNQPNSYIDIWIPRASVDVQGSGSGIAASGKACGHISVANGKLSA